MPSRNARQVVRGLVGLGVVSGGCATRSDLAPLIDDLAARWYPFHWVDVTVGAERIEGASVLVTWPEERTGVRHELQLDFGLAGQGLFGVPIRHLAVDGTAPRPGRLAGRVPALGMRDDSTGATGLRVGTLGLLAFYLGASTVIVDPVARRIGRVPSADSLPAAIQARLRWAPIREVEGRLHLPLAVGGDPKGEVLVDPASSLVPLWLTPELWREVTGRTGAEAGNPRLVLPAAGRPVVLIGAAPRRPLRIGDLEYSPPLVFHLASGPAEAELAALDRSIVGVAGTHLLGAWRLLVIDLRRKRMAALP